MNHDAALIDRLNAMGLQLPAAPKPQALYAPWSMHPLDSNGSSSLVVLSGQTCRRNGVPMVGTCRTDSDVVPAREAAQIAALNALALLHAACEGKLERVKRLLRLRGFVASSADFTLHSQVLDGSSELLKVAFPDLPLPARTAVGVSSLPAGCWVEVELEAVIE